MIGLIMTAEGPNKESLLEALEEFVLDSESITNLEARFGGFNVFEAIGHVHAEERHSDFLAFLMDPQGNHGLDDFFLKRFIQEVLKNVPRSDRSIDLLKLSLADLGGTLVLREHRNIDVLAINDHENLVIVIENKIKSSEHSQQLQRYRTFIEEAYPSHHRLFVYLTPTAEEPSDDAYTAFGYETIADLVDEILQTRSHSLSPAPKFALEHYLEVLRRHIVSDPDLTQLARSIYQKHKKALDYIFEQKTDLQLEISAIFQKLVEDKEVISTDRSTKSYVNFVPVEWNEITAFNLTPTNQWTKSGRSLLFEFRNAPTRVSLALVMGPTSNEAIRDEVYGFCQTKKDLFKRLTDKVYPQYMTLFSLPVLSQKKLEQDNLEELEAEIKKKWEAFFKSEFPKIRDALSKKFTTWQGP